MFVTTNNIFPIEQIFFMHELEVTDRLTNSK